MRILLTGATGQLGHELAALLTGHQVSAPTRNECDLSDARSIRDAVSAARPELIINPGAYTAVDKAEQEPALARAINADAPAVLAAEARRLGVPLIHFSTDYVFDGVATKPYVETHPTGPINVYGETKLQGEQAVQSSGCAFLILRTSWVYSRRGKNFLSTIERLAGERDRLTIVGDQHGTPNWARELARATVALGARSPDELSARRGIYHLSCSGATTWHGFAAAIVESMPLDHHVDVAPITTAEYPTPARRPAYSVLDVAKIEREFGIVLPHWTEALAACKRNAPPASIPAARHQAD